MRVVWGDGEVTLIEDGEDDSEALSDSEVEELARLLVTSTKLGFVLEELIAQIAEHRAAGRTQAAANASAVLAAIALLGAIVALPKRALH